MPEEKKEKSLFQDLGESFKEYADFLPSPPPFPPIPWGITKDISGKKKPFE